MVVVRVAHLSGSEPAVVLPRCGPLACYGYITNRGGRQSRNLRVSVKFHIVPLLKVALEDEIFKMCVYVCPCTEREELPYLFHIKHLLVLPNGARSCLCCKEWYKASKAAVEYLSQEPLYHISFILKPWEFGGRMGRFYGIQNSNIFINRNSAARCCRIHNILSVHFVLKLLPDWYSRFRFTFTRKSIQ